MGLFAQAILHCLALIACFFHCAPFAARILARSFACLSALVLHFFFFYLTMLAMFVVSLDQLLGCWFTGSLPCSLSDKLMREMSMKKLDVPIRVSFIPHWSGFPLSSANESGGSKDKVAYDSMMRSGWFWNGSFWSTSLQRHGNDSAVTSDKIACEPNQW